jgi:hypothetical protein
MKASSSLSCAAMLALLPAAPVGLAGDEGRSCNLLGREELAAAGFAVRGKPQLQTVKLQKGEHLAPTDIRSEVCFLPVESSGDRYGIYLSIDSFAEDISPATLAAWAKTLGGDDRPGTESTSGNISCETGSYPYTEPGAGKRIGTQSYVACDIIEGRRRVSVNLQAPEDKPALPAVEEVRTLLARAWRRL